MHHPHQPKCENQKPKAEVIQFNVTFDIEMQKIFPTDKLNLGIV